MSPITNAKDRPLFSGAGNLPAMGDALLDWLQPMQFKVITKTVVNGDNSEVETSVNTRGVRQPLSAQRLAMKPEGQRAWKWERIHTLPDLVLSPDDVVLYNSIRYRVMAKTDFSEYGYVEYEVVQDYQAAST